MTMKLFNIRRSIVTMVMAVAVAVGAMAQADAAFSHFWAGKGYYNPAVAGELSAIRMNLGSRMQWVDFKHAPMTFYLNVDMPYKLMGVRFGSGVKAEFERIGLFTSTRIGAQLSWRKKIGKGYASIGIQPGVFSQVFRAKERELVEEEGTESDIAIPSQEVSGTKFDANVGIYYTHPYFWAGFSVTHVTAPRIELKASRDATTYYEFEVNPGYYFMAGGNIPVNNSLFEIQPMGMFAYTQNFWTAEVAARMRYNRLLSIGAGYRWKDAVTAFIGVNLKDAFIGYAYDYPVSAISKATFGSHEVFVTYNVKLDPKEKNKNKQKSVRLM